MATAASDSGVLLVCRSACYPYHTSTLHTVNNLGLLYRGQGKLAEAEQMFVRALAGTEKVLGPDHTSTFSTVQSLLIILYPRL